jgi:hypothetical protein
MKLNLEPDYIGIAQHALPQLHATANRYGGPMGIVGKIVGLSGEEIREGLPWWGWASIGLVGGAVLGYVLHDKISKVV